MDKPADYFDRYSRQYYVIGARAMNSLGKASVLVSGINGLGLEIAKNVVLAGPKSVTLHDVANITLSDMATHYYLAPEDVGKNRAAHSLPFVSELNPYVKVEASSTPFIDNFAYLENFSCVVLVGAPLKDQLAINQFCRTKNIKFLVADNYGLFAWTFVDLGNEFTVFDKNGELEKEIFIGGISQDKKAEVTTLGDALHDLEDGDVVRFTEINGMDQLNWKETVNEVDFKIQVVNPKKFTIDVDTTSYPKYINGGLAVEKKQNSVCSFKSLQDSLSAPEFLESDLGKIGRSFTLHVGMQALHQFVASKGSLPRPWNQEDAAHLVELATAIDKLYFDALELIEGFSIADAQNFEPEGNRYDSQIICIGKQTHKKLQDANIFMVGAGAIGCEMIKNYAMLGISSGNGKITITDNDIIEKSNLNRQFLFRDEDIRQPKSTTAVKSALKINPSLHFEANLDKVGPETEHKYTTAFFESQHCLVNALDNVAARTYMDQRAITSLRPLMESGTMGTKGHVQIILPHLTETYQDTKDPPEKDVPYCTIRSFPSSINHTIEWARDKFQTLFVQKPRELQKFLAHPQFYLSQIEGSSGPSFSTLSYLLKMCTNPITTFQDCVRFARRKFSFMYIHEIKQLLHQYPLDKTNKDGELFWTLPKRPPTAPEFNIEDPLHYDFIVHVSALIANIYNIENPHWAKEELIKACAAVDLPTFKIKDQTITSDETAKAPEKEVVDIDKFQTIADQLRKVTVPSLKLSVEEFEKDDDTNHHVDFILATSNLRAIAYQINPSDRMETKRIAGKIIPAIATTTATISGLVSLELIKVIRGGLELEAFKNIFLNLGLPSFAMSEPAKAKRTFIPGTTASYTTWDSWEVRDKPDILLADFCQSFVSRYGLTVTGVFKGVTAVYLSLFPAEQAKLTQKLRDLVGEVEENHVDLVVSFEDENGEDVDGPTVKFFL